MGTDQLRKQVGEFISTEADERFLHLVYGMMKEDEQIIVAYTTDGKPLTKAAYIEEIKAAEAEFESGETLTHEEVVEQSKKW